jgi:hypothetical protein
MSLTLARLGVVAGSFPIAAGGDFESIATVTVGSGGAANIEFTSIPGTYQHLQIRALLKESGGTTDYSLLVQLNGDTGSNYATHYIYADGSSVSAGGESSTTRFYGGSIAAGNKTYFGANIIDILDYANTTRNKTARCLGGQDQNGSGNVQPTSGLWMDTSAITSIKLLPAVSGFVQHSTAALYGIKAP